MNEDALSRLLALAAAATPRCGEVTVVGIDGPSGSGKSTLAAAFARLWNAPVVAMDELCSGWDGLADNPERLASQVLRPLAAGHDASYRRWDWVAGDWADTIPVPWTPRLVVEGCACTVGPAARFVAVPVWVEADLDVRMARGIERDGESFRPHWERWAAQEAAVFGADATRDRAHLIVRT